MSNHITSYRITNFTLRHVKSQRVILRHGMLERQENGDDKILTLRFTTARFKKKLKYKFKTFKNMNVHRKT